MKLLSSISSRLKPDHASTPSTSRVTQEPGRPPPPEAPYTKSKEGNMRSFLQSAVPGANTASTNAGGSRTQPDWSEVAESHRWESLAISENKKNLPPKEQIRELNLMKDKFIEAGQKSGNSQKVKELNGEIDRAIREIERKNNISSNSKTEKYDSGSSSQSNKLGDFIETGRLW